MTTHAPTADGDSRIVFANANVDRAGIALDAARERSAALRKLMRQADDEERRLDAAHKVAWDERDRVIRAENQEATD